MTTYLITGANRGIGYELCKLLRHRGDVVIAVCRKPSTALDELGVEVISGVDVTDSDSIQALARQLQGRSLDVLINNAGLLSDEPLTDLNLQRIHQQFQVNAVGPLLVSQLLLPNLSRGSKLVIITSRMGSIEDNGSGGMYGYRMSKAAANMVGKSLAADLRSHGIAVRMLHPGLVATEMTDYAGIPPQQAAEGLVARIDEMSLANTGEFWHANGEQLPW